MVQVVWPSFHIQFRKTGVEDHHNLRMPQGGSCLGPQHQRLMGCLWCILALSRSRNENWERILKYVNNCKYVYIYSKYIHICEWNPLKSLFKTRRLGYGIYYYEGLGFQWAHVSCNPLEQFNQVGVRHLVVKDGAVTMLYEASWRLLIGVIKCQHIDMSNLNPNQNRIEIKSINWHGRFLLISIWQFFFLAATSLRGFRTTQIVPQCSTWQEQVISWLTSHCWTLPRKMGLHEMQGFSNCF